jgi:hypothetical protein
VPEGLELPRFQNLVSLLSFHPNWVNEALYEGNDTLIRVLVTELGCQCCCRRSAMPEQPLLSEMGHCRMMSVEMGRTGGAEMSDRYVASLLTSPLA